MIFATAGYQLEVAIGRYCFSNILVGTDSTEITITNPHSRCRIVSLHGLGNEYILLSNIVITLER